MTNEEVIKEFDDEFPTDEWIEQSIYTRLDKCLNYGMEDIREFVLQALQEQRQSILKEIEKEITELESDLQGHMAYTAVERIKQLLK